MPSVVPAASAASSRPTSAKGASSAARSWSSDLFTVGTSLSVERSLPPWPGKCFATVSMRPALPSCTPRTKARPSSPTHAGLPPNERVPMSPLPPERGLSSTSTTGPSSMLTPAADSSLPTIDPVAAACVLLHVAPMVRLFGTAV